ncbi:MAG: DUF4258 domain-containing protein [Trueperaceae bacterium]|nr:DUF4258 domain-containing protein [Trueperaceae bacterium]
MDESRRDPTTPGPREPERRGASRRSPHGRPRRPRRRTLGDLRPLVREGRYRIARHAAQHAATEGFTEHDIVATVLHGREMVRYLEDERLLVLGWLPISADVKLPLHVVLEFARPRAVDVVTAFIPEEPHRVPSRTRLAEVLRWDAHEPRAEREGKAHKGRR